MNSNHLRCLLNLHQSINPGFHFEENLMFVTTSISAQRFIKESKTEFMEGSKQTNIPADECLPDKSRFLDHPSGYLALSKRNNSFTVPGIPGFMSYRRQGRHWVSFGGVHAPLEFREDLLDCFIKAAALDKCRYLAIQLREDQIDLFRKRGCTVNQFGSTFAITLSNYTFSGTRKMNLRNKIKQAQSLGCQVVEVGLEIPRNAETFANIHHISQCWLKKKGKKELDFMIGEIGRQEDTLRRIFLVMSGNNEPVAFISYVPVWGTRPGYLHDLTRKLPKAPNGVLELCNSAAIQKFITEGVSFLHFGFTPFIIGEKEPFGASPGMAWLIRLLRKYGHVIYPAESQAQYKMKWGTDIIETEYIAGHPLSVIGAWDLLRLTQSI
jgi:lysylphosphatidylglycerol synthetase-like protein (DUF2156 family)